MPNAIEIERVGRVYEQHGRAPVVALDDVTFSVAEGEVVGLLGVNGAGKTTLTRILATLLLPSNGQARVAGFDVATDANQVRRGVGVVLGGDRGLYNRVSGRENLNFFGMLAGVPRRQLQDRVTTMLKLVNLSDAADRRVETYSKGMRQRLNVAIGLIANPRVLLLDEPTVGLDPIEADRLRDTINSRRDDGVSILLTSHLLLDVERLASRVVVLNQGSVTADLPLKEFVGLAGYAAVITVRYRGPAAEFGETPLPPDATVAAHVTDGSHSILTVKLPEWTGDLFAALGRIIDRIDVEDIDVRPARLEEAFSSASTRRKP